jgi:hypothetical protein
MDEQEKLLTRQQQKAMHLWMKQVAEELNEAGLDMKKVLRPSIDISWTDKSIKEYLWRPVQYALLHKKSTTILTRKEIDIVWEELNRFLGEKHGIHVPFPCIESLINETL